MTTTHSDPPYATVDGQGLSYRQYRAEHDGVPIVLLSRFQGTIDYWDPEVLSRRAGWPVGRERCSQRHITRAFEHQPVTQHTLAEMSAGLYRRNVSTRAASSAIEASPKPSGAHASDRAQNRPCFPVGTRLPDHWSPAPLGAESAIRS
jgi:hypothetical protein